MFARLFCKELKYQWKSITLYLFFAVVILFYATQFYPEIGKDPVREPAPPSETAKADKVPQGVNAPYGFTHDDNPLSEMKAVYAYMSRDYQSGQYLSYKWIFVKYVRLSPRQKSLMKKTMDEIAPGGTREGDGELKIATSYERYLELVRGLDKALGGSTYYGDSFRSDLAKRPRTYEEALADYRSIIREDKLTNAYARLFGDYMGITAGFFPVFLSAFILTRDRRSRMHELIDSRKASSLTLLLSRFLSLSFSILFCYRALAVHATVVLSRTAAANGYATDPTAFFKVVLCWILPTVLFTVSTGMLLSLLVGNGIPAIPVQFVLWMASMMPLEGNYSLTRSVIRFNTLGNHAGYMEWRNAIAANRIFFTLLSVLLVGVALGLYSLRRGGAFRVPAPVGKKRSGPAPV